MTASKYRTIAKRLLGSILWPFPTSLLTRRLIGGKQGLILTFHYIGEPILPGVGEDLFLSREAFAKILDFVCSSLCPVDPSDFFSDLPSGALPASATLLTFDDCTEQTLKIALPELLKRKLKACFFANPGLIEAGRTVPALELMSLCARVSPGRHEVRLPDKLDMDLDIVDGNSRVAAYRRLWPLLDACSSRKQPALLMAVERCFGCHGDLPDAARLASWNDLQLLHASGMVVGNHTPFHSTAQADGLDQFKADVAQAYDMLEGRFASPWRVFCYPYGRTSDATPETAARLRELRTDYAFVTQGGVARLDRLGSLNLRREDAAYSVGATKLAPLLACIRMNRSTYAA